MAKCVLTARGFFWLLAAMMTTGCEARSKQPEDQPVANAPAIQSDTSGAAAEGCFECQPRVAELTGMGSAQQGFHPAATPWRPISDPAARLDRLDGASISVVMAQLIDSLQWSSDPDVAAFEQTLRVRQNDDSNADAIVLQWGIGDDAVAGRDVRVRLNLSQNAWHADSIMTRFWCRRRVSSAGVCE